MLDNKDAQRVEIEDALPTNELLDEIHTSPHLTLFQECIDQQGLSKGKEDGFERWKADKEKTKIVVESLRDALVATQKDNEDDLEIPDDFDIDAESKLATQGAISIMHRKGLVDLPLIREASKFVGPGNTRFVRDKFTSEFYHRNLWGYYMDTQQHERLSPLQPLPSQRNKYMGLLLGEISIKRGALSNIRVARSAGLKLSVQEALRMALISTAGHEYTHGIDFALNELGKPSLSEAKRLGFLRGRDQLDEYDINMIHREHLARGMEDVIEKVFLKEELQWSDLEIEAFFAANRAELYKTAKAPYALLAYLTQQGYSPWDIRRMTFAIGEQMSELYEEKFFRQHFRPLEGFISYLTPPYTEEQVKILINGGLKS